MEIARHTDGAFYVVERIVALRLRPNRKDFYVKWVGLPMAECSWVEEANMLCPGRIQVQ